MKKAVLYFLLVLPAIPGFAWGPTGHRTTGWIAEQYLSAKAKAKIKQLLGQESLAIAATWMDDIRSDSTYNYTADWHWVTVPTGMKYEQSTKNPHGDVIMTIERLIAEIKSHTLTAPQEAEHVRMLVHLIGDLHQPLHVGFGDDQGGNKVKVKWFRNDSNLHRVWDSDMIDDTRLSYTELAQSLTRPDKTVVKNLQSSNAKDWAYESMQYRDQVYAIGDGNLGYKFSYKNLPLVRKRLTEAGIRIAGVLNSLYA